MDELIEQLETNKDCILTTLNLLFSNEELINENKERLILWIQENDIELFKTIHNVN